MLAAGAEGGEAGAAELKDNVVAVGAGDGCAELALPARGGGEGLAKCVLDLRRAALGGAGEGWCVEQAEAFRPCGELGVKAGGGGIQRGERGGAGGDDDGAGFDEQVVPGHEFGRRGAAFAD